MYAQTEYYIPQRQKPIEQGQTQFGLDTRIRTNGGSQRYYEIIPSVTYSPGLLPRFQMSAELPLVYARQSQTTIGDDSETGIGDLLVNTRYTLYGEPNWQLVGSLEGVLATGKNPFENDLGTGDGFDRLTPGVTFLVLKDPVSAFFHLGYEISFEETFDVPVALSNQPQTLRDLLRLVLFGPSNPLPAGENTINPGNAVRLRGGTSILLNPTTRFNLFGSISFRNEQEVNGQEQTGSQRDDARLGAGMDFDLNPRTQLSMNFIWGVTSTSDDVVWVSGVTYRY